MSQARQAAALGISQWSVSRVFAQSGITVAWESWKAESQRSFAIPPQRSDVDSAKAFSGVSQAEKDAQSEYREQEWVATASWTYCHTCGRHRADGKLALGWEKRGAKAVRHERCAGGCDPNEVCADKPSAEPSQVSEQPGQQSVGYHVDPKRWAEAAAEAECTMCRICGQVCRRGEVAGDAPHSAGEKILMITCDTCTGENPSSMHVPAGPPAALAPSTGKLKVYVTPQRGDWCEALFCKTPEEGGLTDAECASLAPIDIRCDYVTMSGKYKRAPVTSKKKTSIVRATWRKQEIQERSLSHRAPEAFRWLQANNATYARYLEYHRKLLEKPDKETGWHIIKTAQLLLNMPGVEVAARPWLYPSADYGDSDLRSRLLSSGRITERQKPSLKSSFMRKLTSRCTSYEDDFPLFCLLHDIALAKQISAVVAIADKQKIAPEDAAVGMQNFDVYWAREQEKLEDMVRIRQDMLLGAKQPSRKGQSNEAAPSGFPNLFYTISPAEWKYQHHRGVQGRRVADESLSSGHVVTTLHIYNTLVELMEKMVLKLGDPPQAMKDMGIEEVYEFSYRFEFQGRGTMHVHVVAWVKYKAHMSAQDITNLSGRTGEKTSPFVEYLERLFKSSIDVQCTEGSTCLLRYVTGYVSKASDAITFSGADAGTCSRWRQIFRLMCKKAPLVPEMTVAFAMLPLMKASFRSDSLHAQIPRTAAEKAIRVANTRAPKRELDSDAAEKNRQNYSRRMYDAYLTAQKDVDQRLQHEAGMPRVPFLPWARKYTIEKKDGHDAWTPKERGGHGAGKNKARCAVGISYPYELLDNFLGAWLAMNKWHRCEEDLARYKDDPAIPEGAKFLKAAMGEEYYDNDVEALIADTTEDFRLRGLSENRINTFKQRLRAVKLMLDACENPEDPMDPRMWSAKDIRSPPSRKWSPEQDEALDAIGAGVNIIDGNVEHHGRRTLLMTGGPGTGKTEVVVHAALRAANNGERVLIACPIGALVDTYRERLPPHHNIVIETVHASFKITRRADQQYVPPGRLRTFDLIIFDEASQLQADVWEQIKVACGELVPGPFICIVGDFQQLQPVDKDTQLYDDVMRQVNAGVMQHVELLPHLNARSTDDTLLQFLHVVRTEQPSKTFIEEFFGERRLSSDRDEDEATEEALMIERARGPDCKFTFLTVTNAGAAALNRARVLKQFGHLLQGCSADDVATGDPSTGGGPMYFAVGMRIRLTRNVDKQHSFVNGTLGVIEHVLSSRVFVLRTDAGVRVLVHPVHYDTLFMPTTYGYAITMRRAQGSTLQTGALWFNHSYPADRGYAYVGASRFKKAKDLYLMGKVRRSDWLPVGSERDGQQLRRETDSESTDEEERMQRREQMQQEELEEECADEEMYLFQEEADEEDEEGGDEGIHGDMEGAEEETSSEGMFMAPR